ncbi:hypothetical protein DIJ63_26925 [Burkholderia pseudomallei]|nr:hypothetical protein DIJ63_26925 [Burkholderia pseudomallei]
MAERGGWRAGGAGRGRRRRWPVGGGGWRAARPGDGHRYWERREWEEHHRHRGFCPPGHAKKGEC